MKPMTMLSGFMWDSLAWADTVPGR
jgi:hypothetical protein